MQLPNDKENPMSLGKLSNQKSNGTWELVQIGGGVVKKSKKSEVQLGKVQN